MMYKTAKKNQFIEFLSSELYEKECRFCKYNCVENKIESIRELVEIATNSNKLNLSMIPPTFNNTCPFIKRIVSEINDSVVEFNNFKDKLDIQNNSLVSYINSLDNFNSIISGVKNNYDEFVIDETFNTNQIINEFNYQNVIVSEVVITVNKKDNTKKIYLHIKSEDVGKSIFGEVLYKAMKTKFIIDGIEKSSVFGYSIVCYVTAPKYKLFFGLAQKSKEQKSGDNVLWKKLANKNYVLALCDGMGTGDSANERSNQCLELLDSFLELNIENKNTVEIINRILYVDKSNVFSTLDMVEINTYNGQASFYKLASSLSFVKHKDQCKIISAESLPVGVVDSVKPTIESTFLESEDYIVVCSDGVVDALGEKQIISILESSKAFNSQLLAETIIDEAGFMPNSKDDLTCAVVKILEER